MKCAYLVLLCVVHVVIAQNEDSTLSSIFAEYGSEGTLLLVSNDNQKSFAHNTKRSQERFTAASTFKIPNTLIALECGAVKDENQIIPWDSVDQGMPEWNKDQSLSSALPVSCVWFYQELAKRVGKDKYKEYLAKLNYGNETVGLDVTTFWLDGSLKISAAEQIDFLKKIYANELPFSLKHLRILKKIMIVEQDLSYIIRAKTGMAVSCDPKVGWFTGYVETAEAVWFFALNMDIKTPEDLKLRKEIVIEALKKKGIIN